MFSRLSCISAVTGAVTTVIATLDLVNRFLTTEPVGEGSGTRPSFCYGFVRAGGPITADSDVGHGSLFTISLPIKTAQMETDIDLLGIPDKQYEVF